MAASEPFSLTSVEVLFFAGPILWISGWIAASIFYRKRRGKAIFPRPPEDSVFLERRASGHEHRGIITRLGGASRCLTVAVTPDRFHVFPQFPFNLMFLPEIWGLEHDLPLAQVRIVERSAGVLGPKLRLSLGNNGEREFSLYLKGADRVASLIDSSRG